jgi:hypothetical protein
MSESRYLLAVEMNKGKTEYVTKWVSEEDCEIATHSPTTISEAEAMAAVAVCKAHNIPFQLVEDPTPSPRSFGTASSALIQKDGTLRVLHTA